MRLLTRLASKLEASAEARLQTVMQIPREWFFEAKALRARHEQRFCDEAHFLLIAGLSIDAHETLVRHVGPDCIISGDLEPLAKVLRAFTSVDNIPNWSFGGRVYQNAIALVEGQNTAGSHAFAKEIVKTLPSMSTSSFKQKVAINEIGSMCLQVLPSAENLRPKFKLASHDAFSVKAHSALQAFRSLAA
ncbi:hypothetical protein BCR37DRAFT_382742 [Protomyces lactucae-debilis]|uniref:Uncharacterized protein n=1 Tax=Protomyces lactucae-debilis TaxID=2754530 RepID=A0A1Y2F0B4_PROLT|nr:uncharacterized protein BCR37DRAFT_382742 [Protomyces lactucae-debilis]ORY77280.1 hypothetical protein BCR37DRAFT_382742 [Protomyces lactucae-debilis]